MSNPNKAERFIDVFPYAAALVIGGRGFIGSRVVADLHDRYRVPVVSLDDGSRKNPATIADTIGTRASGLISMEGDALSDADVGSALKLARALGRDIDRGQRGVAVFHLAAHTRNDPVLPFESMRLNTSAPVRALRLLGRTPDSAESCFVFASSFAVYGGTPFGSRCHEGRVGEYRPLTDYGRSKVVAEGAVQAETYAGGLEAPYAASLRFSNVLGIGEAVGPVRTADASGGLVAALAGALATPGSSIRLPKPVASTPSGYPYRDFVDVRDVARAMIRTAERMKTGPGYRDLRYLVANVCSGESRSIHNVPIEAAVEYFADVDRDPRFDPDNSSGSNSWIKTAIGWDQKRSFSDSVDWIVSEVSTRR